MAGPARPYPTSQEARQSLDRYCDQHGGQREPAKGRKVAREEQLGERGASQRDRGNRDAA